MLAFNTGLDTPDDLGSPSQRLLNVGGSLSQLATVVIIYVSIESLSIPVSLRISQNILPKRSQIYINLPVNP